MEKDQTDHPARPAPVRLAFRVSYLGSRFFGSQMQAANRTVEGEFIATCRRLDLFDDWRQAGFLSAGRTDRGVHARGQVIVFTTGYPDRALQALNLQLPPDLWCTGYAEVTEQFHPRFDAKFRIYRYYFAEKPADVGEMMRAAVSFLGTHNFSNFARATDRNPYRNIQAIRIDEEDGFVFLEVRAESFLWHQVRCMAAALISVGMGEEDAGSISHHLEQTRVKSLQPAPAEGLVLWDTDVGVTWTCLPAGDRSTHFMDHLCRHHALMEKVCSVLKSS